MNKMFAVLKREYLQTVRKKSFIIMTLIFPFLMAGLMIVPGLLMAKGMGVKRIAVLDGTGKLEEAFARPNEPEKTDPKEEAQKALTGRRRGPELPAQIHVEYVNFQGKDLEKDGKSYRDRLTRKDAADKLEGVFAIPQTALTDEEARFTYYSRSATDIMTQERLSRMANKSLQRMRLSDNGMNPEVIDQLMRDLQVSGVQLSRSGQQKKGGELNFLMAFIFGALVVLPAFLYGQETMRGIVQEKSDRVVEVLVSSMRPIDLLAGKILGIALVGLTQITVWLTMVGLVGSFGAAVAMVAKADINLAQFIRPWFFVYFVLFYILGYLTYVCIYAIAGAACNNEREAQQFIAPIMIFMMLPWILMMPIIMNPDAPFAVAFSISPVFAPITMFVRVMVSEPPIWHVLISIGVSIVTILAFFWATAKIFRIGILSYGKRPTIPELWRWMKVA